MTKTVLGIFDDRAACEDAITDLEDAGYKAKDISIMMKDAGEAQTIAHDTGADVTGGAVSGATTGAVVGGIAGLLAGTVMPALGGFLIGGPIGAALGLTGAAATTASGAVTGAVAGGLIGALMSLGLTREEATVYQDKINEGAILLAVPEQPGMTREVRAIMDDHGATDIRTISAGEDRLHTSNKANDDYVVNNYGSDDYRPMAAKGGRARREVVDDDEEEI